ncbi:unnamed protein product [Hydatigera taeniaeformis]|uniref:Glyco_hydro_38N domain-containing protein n=1 Tax=Hydatigena taeniaeformis TaxID=6205 RepID=A0A0R3XBJ7_HYDTA|nr:unnamed protein product [Hydatigera taeniaeformis]
MFIRGPLRRFVVVFTVFFVVVLLIYFYATRGFIDMEILQEKVQQFNDDIAEKLKWSGGAFGFMKQKELKCEPQVVASFADIEPGTLYDSIPFKNEDGGVWKQGFNISYSLSDWDKQKLEVIVLPHSHQDTGSFWTMTFSVFSGILWLKSLF